MKYLGYFDNLHRIAFKNLSRITENNQESALEIILETDFKRQRTIESIKSGETLIKDSIVLSSNQKVLDLIKCN